MRPPHRIVVVVGEPVGGAPSEAVERAIRLAAGLAKSRSVVLCSTSGAPPQVPGVVSKSLAGPSSWLGGRPTSLVIATRTAAGRLPRGLRGPLCVDLGSFSPADFSAQDREGATGVGIGLREQLRLTNAALRAGDFFLCATEADRPSWLGALAAAGRIRARLYDADPKLRSLLDVAPLETGSRQYADPEELPDAIRRYCTSPWKNPHPAG